MGCVRAVVGVVLLAGLVGVVCCWGPVGVAFGSGFGAKGEAAGQFTGPQGVAVDQESGRVFVTDREGLRVERWSGGGVFERLWGRGVNATGGGNLCLAGEVCVAGEPGTGPGEFAEFPSGVAVDNSLGLSHGNVYVVDDGNNRVQEFSADGEFVLMFGKNVNGAGDVCLAGESCQAGEAGGGAGAFSRLVGNDVAVDGAGVVYVGDENRVQKFSSGGVLIGEVALPGVGAVTGLAVDGEGNMYVVGEGQGGVHKYDPAGVELGEPRDPAIGPERTVITVGPTDELFVYDNLQRHVQEYAADGTQVSSVLLEGRVSGGLAFGNELGVLYVLFPKEVVVLTPPAAGPVVVEGSESVDGVLPNSAVAHALVNPEGPEAASVSFEYGPTEGYGSSTTPQAVEGGFEDQPATGDLSGLAPATVYHVRAVAKNGLHTTDGPDLVFETAPAVSVETESVSEVTGDSARLEASLNPHGLASEYHFEYGTSSAYGASVPVPDGLVAAGSEGVPVHVRVQGLAAQTLYHYRVLAHNALGTHAGPDQTFMTDGPPAGALADGREWELVSPVNKHGAALESMADEGAMIQAAADGHALTYAARAPVSNEPPGSRTTANTQLLSQRTTPGVWGTQDITTPHEQIAGLIVGKLSEYQAFSSDLSLGAVEPAGATPLNPELMGERKERTPYLRNSSGEYAPLVTEANTPPGVKFGGEENSNPGAFSGGTEFLTMTPDGSKLIVASPQPLVEGVEASGSAPNLYEWQAGKLTLVSVMPDGSPATTTGTAAGLGNNNEQTRGALSNDGSRVVFETNESHFLGLRDVARGETLQLNAPQGGVRPHTGTVRFQVATGDGSRVFFTDDARLTPDATAKVGEPDLYMCDVRVLGGVLSCALSDLTVDPNRNETARVLGDVIGIDQTGRYVYFVADGALAPGAVHGGCEDQKVLGASCNLYVRDVVAGVTSLVAVLPDSDLPDWQAAPNGANLGDVTAGVSGNGRFLAFMSSRSLTGFDNRDVVSGVRDVEVFEYDRERGSVVCVSCGSGRPVGVFDDPHAAAPLVDRQEVWSGQTLAGSIPGWTKVTLGRALYRSRYLFDSGRLFFDSTVGLVAGDGNGSEDVYEFEPSGVGGCVLGSGCVGLLSGGSASEESAFLDASGSGEDVFFLTAARLLPQQDVDGALDVYDAHACSSAVPCASGVVSEPPACSTVDSCRAAPAAQPDIFGAPASQLFNGNGNVTPGPAPKTPVLSRAQKLTRALHACQKKPRRRRAACRHTARKRYGPVAHKSRVRAAGLAVGGVR